MTCWHLPCSKVKKWVKKNALTKGSKCCFIGPCWLRLSQRKSHWSLCQKQEIHWQEARRACSSWFGATGRPTVTGTPDTLLWLVSITKQIEYILLATNVVSFVVVLAIGYKQSSYWNSFGCTFVPDKSKESNNLRCQSQSAFTLVSLFTVENQLKLREQIIISPFIHLSIDASMWK